MDKRQPNKTPSVESVAGGTEDTGVSIEQKVDALIQTAITVRKSLNRRTVVFGALVLIKILFLLLLINVAHSNQENGRLLVECTTPGTNPNPTAINDTGNACWDRLHASGSTDNAIALIVDNIYCDHRRAQAKLPPIADPTKTCRSQTPIEVLNP